MNTATPASAILSAQNVGLCYRLRKQLLQKPREIWALRGLDFQIFEGEKLGLLGRNGVGKSTLMRMLAGIFAPSEGKLLWHKKLHVQLLSLGVGFEGSLSGRENAVLNGMLLGKSRQTMLERVEAIKEYSELGDFFEYPVNTYSSGMVMRLGFSVAMECDPDVILLDELLGVGDFAFQEKSEKTLKQKFHGDKTMVLISHHLDILENLCTRVLWIEHGGVRMSGSPKEVVAEFKKAKLEPPAHKIGVKTGDR